MPEIFEIELGIKDYFNFGETTHYDILGNLFQWI